MTDAEQQLWRGLRKRQVAGHRFRRQHPIGSYMVDFVCMEANLIAEVDGGQHMGREEYDHNRTARLEARGFRVLRFWNHEVLNQTADVMSAIWHALASRLQPPSHPSP